MLEKSEEIKLCKCGCGLPAMNRLGYEYAHGHKPSKNYSKIECPICKKGFVFLQLHIVRKHGLDPLEVQKQYNLPSLTSSALKESRKGEKNSFFGKHHSNSSKEQMIMKRDGKACKYGEKPRCIVCGKKLAAHWAKYCREHYITEEFVSKISESCRNASLKKWQEPDFITNQMNGRKEQPNKCERLLDSVLNDLFPEEYRFVGDWQIVIGGKCPDFINTNGQKKLIELFGDYWHRNDNPEDRIQKFAKYGFDTLVIWEKELKDLDLLRQKLMEFHNRKRFNEHNQNISNEMMVCSGLQGDLKRLAEMTSPVLMENQHE